MLLEASKCREHFNKQLSVATISILAQTYIAWPVMGDKVGSAKAFRAISAPSPLALALRRLPGSCTWLSEATPEDSAVHSGIVSSVHVYRDASFSPLLFTGGRFAAGRSSSFLEFWKLPIRAHWCWLLCSPLTISVHNFHRNLT